MPDRFYGYNNRALRRSVLKESRGLCVKCGRSADETHHVYDPTIPIIRPLCWMCHLVAPNGDQYWEWETSGKAGSASCAERSIAGFVLRNPGVDLGDLSMACQRAMDIYCGMRSAFRSDTTTFAMHHKRDKGERAGFIPYGFKAVGGMLVNQDVEQGIIERVRAERSAGTPLRQIAGGLNRSRLKTRSGKPWKHQYIANILKEKP